MCYARRTVYSDPETMLKALLDLNHPWSGGHRMYTIRGAEEGHMSRRDIKSGLHADITSPRP